MQTDDLSTIKKLSTDIYQNVKTSKRNTVEVNTTSEVNTTLLTPKPTQFAQILKEQRSQSRQSTSMKRTAAAMKTPTNSKPKKLPQAKVGTRSISSNLKIAPAPKPKPKLDRAIHVSRMDTSVTVEILNEYISQNTQLKLNENFKCSLLVKKDVDISKLTFISFKVDVDSDNFNVLSDVDFWPQGAMIREFISQPKTAKFGDFLERNQNDESMQPNKVIRTESTVSKNEAENSSSTSNLTVPEPVPEFGQQQQQPLSQQTNPASPMEIQGDP